jgi:hypothetical protein
MYVNGESLAGRTVVTVGSNGMQSPAHINEEIRHSCYHSNKSLIKSDT